jgi:hypothetical protein
MPEPGAATPGHGHVVPRPDGARARCGGPALCSACAKELAAQQQSGATPGQAAAWDAWYAADQASRTMAQGFSESKYEAMRRAFLAGTEAQAAIAAAAPAAPQPAPGDWWICDGPLPDARKLLGPFATQELALNVRTYVEKAEKRSDLWVDDEPQQPQPAPGPCPGCESLRRQCSEIAGEVGILAGALTEIRDNDHPYGSYARDKARAALDVLHGLAPQAAPGTAP